MTLVLILAAALLALIYNVIVNVILTDIYQGMPSFARWLICRRAAKLPPGLSERMHEEWLADMESYTTHLAKLSLRSNALQGSG